ncbi:MAG: NAD(P)/FAD-dependent oxidoreductase [Candidatus Methanodesulfokora sp.]
MKNKYDVIIIGAGITGLMISYKLSHYNLRVLVIERNPEPGWGVSRGHAAVVHVVQLPFKSLKSKLARAGNKELLRICKELGVRHRITSTLILATKFYHFLALPFVYLYLKMNLKGFEVKLRGRRSLLREEPALSPKILGGIEVKGYAVVDSFDLIYGLYEFSRVNGVEFAFEEEVRSIEYNGTVKVITDKGEYESNYLINAAGLWADEIFKLTGGEMKFELGKGVMVVFDKAVSERLLAPLYLKADPKTKGGAIMFTHDGRGLWGPNLRLTHSKDDISADETDLEILLKKFSKLIRVDPGIPLKAYAGIRPIPPQNDFVLERSGDKIIHVLGTESPGFTASPALSELVIKMLTESGLRVEEKPVSKRRRFERARDDPKSARGRVICFCNLVTEDEIREAVRRGSKTLKGVFYRTGACMGTCQGSRCLADVLEIVADELKVNPRSIKFDGDGSWIVT